MHLALRLMTFITISTHSSLCYCDASSRLRPTQALYAQDIGATPC